MAKEKETQSTKPMGFKVIVNEVVHDKLALFSFILLVVLVLGIFIA